MVSTPFNLIRNHQNERRLDFGDSGFDRGTWCPDFDGCAEGSTRSYVRTHESSRKNGCRCRPSPSGGISSEGSRNRVMAGSGPKMHFRSPKQTIYQAWNKIRSFIAPKPYNKEEDSVYQMMKRSRARSLEQARASNRQVRELRMNRVEETWLNRPRGSK